MSAVRLTPQGQPVVTASHVPGLPATPAATAAISAPDPALAQLPPSLRPAIERLVVQPTGDAAAIALAQRIAQELDQAGYAAAAERVREAVRRWLGIASPFRGVR